MRPRTAALLPVAAALFTLAAAPQARAKAAYVGLPEAIAQAEIIAVIRTEQVVPAEIVGSYHAFRQRVSARPLEVLKGELGPRFTFAADRTFICAPVPYEADMTYLVFLGHEGEPLATVNNDWGQMAIVGGRLDWPYDDSDAPRELEPVLAELRALLEATPARPVEPPLPPEPEPSAPAVPEAAAPAAPEAAASAVPDTALPVAPLWIGVGAFAVLLGFGVASRSRWR